MLEGRQFFVAEFSRVATACPPHIVVETYSRECNVYFNTIRHRLATSVHWVLGGSHFFVVEFSGMGTVWLAHIIVTTQSQEYNVYFRAMKQRLAAPDLDGA